MYFRTHTTGGRKIENVFLPGDEEHYKSALSTWSGYAWKSDVFYGRPPTRFTYESEPESEPEVTNDDIMHRIRILLTCITNRN